MLKGKAAAVGIALAVADAAYHKWGHSRLLRWLTGIR